MIHANRRVITTVIRVNKITIITTIMIKKPTRCKHERTDRKAVSGEV